MAASPPDATGGAWLIRGGDVLAALAAAPPGRLLGPGAVGGPGPAALLRRAALVRSGAAALDLAWCRPLDPPPGAGGPAASWEVRRARTVAAHRVVLARPGRGAVVVAPAGAFERWALRVGDRVGVVGA